MSCRICEVTEIELIAESQFSKAFFPENPVGPAHIVVSVREHRPLLDDLTDQEAADVLVTSKRIAAAVRSLAGLEKFYMAAVGDVDLHFHLHLLPWAPGDPVLGPYIFGSDGWAGRRAAKDGTTDELRSRIRKQLGDLR